MQVGRGQYGANAYYQMQNDISLTSASWTSIPSFAGVFDGNGHKISNLILSSSSENAYLGLFYTNYGTIQNLAVDAYIGAHDSFKSAGALTGYNAGYIEACYSQGSFGGDAYCAGGLVGANVGVIENCYSRTDLNGIYVFAGGLSGTSQAGSVINSYAAGTVSAGGTYRGGLIGYYFDTVTASYYDKNTTGASDTGKGSGLDTAQMKNPNSLQDWDLSSLWDLDSGINDGYPHLRVMAADSGAGSSKTAAPTITALDMAGAGKNIVIECSTIGAAIYYTVDGMEPTASSAVYNANTPIALTSAGVYTIKALAAKAGMSDSEITVYTVMIGGASEEGSAEELTGLGTSESPYLVFTETQLEQVGKGKYRPEAYYQLQNDIALTAFSWTPLPYFSGVFDGNAHTITNLNITSSAAGAYNGLFSENAGAIVKLGVAADIDVSGHAGAVVGQNYNNGRIQQCYSLGSVAASGSGGSYIGGLVAVNRGTVEDCYSRAIVTAAGASSTVGGLVGLQPNVNSTIKNSYATGKVMSSYYQGGLVGYALFSYIPKCYYDKNTSGASDVGKGTGLTTAQMKSSQNFSSWDFSGVWGMDETINEGYPYLLWQVS
ncbi:MAG: chitobiase/beta-hexosaminidase C-terminal domain-containing protein [Clostridiales bacterium]|jgi:hypothetical protein|nr:chitobiase/beta-hexosaminidase C-terminal domain-containing protein [Clostridiales bacterium]